MKRVLVIATGKNTKGGITSVVLAHEKGAQWKNFHCKWIASHTDKDAVQKIAALVKGLLIYFCYLPSASIIHVHLSEPPSAMRKLLFLLPAILTKKKIVVHFHAFSPKTTIQGKCRCIYGFVFKYANSLIVLSNYWKNAIDKEFDLGDKIKVVYNPCVISPSNEIVKKENIILYAGAVNSRKGYADLISAFAKVAEKHREWKLSIAGNGEIRRGEKLSEKLGVGNQCTFLGWVSGQQKDKVFKSASIYCLPSYSEGFPMGILDAMAYGLPVITTPVGGIPDVAEDGENMLLFEPGDVDSLAQNLDKLMSDESLRAKLSEASNEFAMTIFNIDTINRQIGLIYADLLKREQTIW